MASGTAETSIAKSPADVWKIIGDFGGLATWMKGVDGCEVEGDIRKIATMGIAIHEKLVEHSDTDRRLSYAIVDSPLPLESHLATITVHADGANSRVTWDVDVTPDEMIGAFQPIYQQSLDALKVHLES